MATGSRPFMPPVKGKERENCYSVNDILNEKVSFSGKTIAVAGSGLTGLETAAFLAERGNHVIVIEMQDRIGPSAYVQNLEDVTERLNKAGAEMMVSCRVEEIKADCVKLNFLKEGVCREIACDGVVLAVGNRSCRDLYEELKKIPGLNVSAVGDTVRPGKIADAVRSACRAALSDR